MFDEGESLANSSFRDHSSSSFRDHSSSSSSTHVCPYLTPYLTLHRLPHSMHTAPPNAADSVPENGPFHRHPTSLGGQSSGEMIHSHSFSATEPQHQNWQQQPSHSFPISGNADQSTSHLSSRLSRNDSSSQQRLGPYVHPHPFPHGSMSRNGSNLVASLGPPVMGDVRGHTSGRGSHIYQQLATSSLRDSPFAPIRRSRPRGLALTSSIASAASAEMGGFYGFSVSGSANRNHQDGESISGHNDRFYGWSGKGFAPLPWIPVEGESQWWGWGPSHPNQNLQSGSGDPTSTNYIPQRVPTERVTHGHPENGYQHMPPPPWMPPFMCTVAS